jgi:hypothetical protein
VSVSHPSSIRWVEKKEKKEVRIWAQMDFYEEGVQLHLPTRLTCTPRSLSLTIVTAQWPTAGEIVAAFRGQWLMRQLPEIVDDDVFVSWSAWEDSQKVMVVHFESIEAGE